MKNQLIILIGCAMGISPLGAEDQPKPERPERPEGDRRAPGTPGARPDGSFFKSLDKDGDGFISKEEAGERWERLGKLDKDGDGKVSLQEMMAFRPEGGRPEGGRPEGGRPEGSRPEGSRPGGDRPASGEMFARLDKNNDGKLTKDEVPAEMWERISRLDKDGDGAVSKEEMAALMAGRPSPGSPDAEGMRRADGERRGTPDGGADSLFSRYDTDKDGKLSKSEVPEEIWARLSKADENADGLISKEELDKVYSGRDGGSPRGERKPDGERPRTERKPES